MNDPGCRLLLRAMVRDDYDALARSLKEEISDYRALMRLLQLNRVAGHFYIKLSHAKVRPQLSDDFHAELKAAYAHQWIKSEIALRDTALLVDMFTSEGEDVIVLKGPLFADRYFGDWALKGGGDIDILLPRCDAFEIGNRILSRHGFRRKSKCLLGFRTTGKFVHALEFNKASIYVDLHWTLRPHFSFKVELDQIDRQKQKHRLRGREFWILSDEHTLVMLALSMFTDLPYGVNQLKTLLDLYVVAKHLEPRFDWPAFFQRREAEGLLTVICNMLDLGLFYLDAYGMLPRLSAALSRHQQRIIWDEREKLNLFKYYPAFLPRKLATLGTRIATLRLYEAPLLKNMAWACMMTPIRFATYGLR